MPKKSSDRTFLINQLRYFIAHKGRLAPTPGIRFRAMMMLAALDGFLDIKMMDKDIESPKQPIESPVEDTPDGQVKAMLDRVARKLDRGRDADKLSEGGTSSS